MEGQRQVEAPCPYDQTRRALTTRCTEVKSTGKRGIEISEPEVVD